jgi:hypothetical protein
VRCRLGTLQKQAVQSAVSPRVGLLAVFIEIEIGIEIAPLTAIDALINRSKRRQVRASRGPVSCRADPDSDPDSDPDFDFD